MNYKFDKNLIKTKAYIIENRDNEKDKRFQIGDTKDISLKDKII